MTANCLVNYVSVPLFHLPRFTSHIKEQRRKVPDLETCFPKGTELENQDLQNKCMSSPGRAFLVVILHQGPHPARKGKKKSKIQMKILALLPPLRGRGAGSLSSSLPGEVGGSPFTPNPTAKVPGPCGWGPGRKPLPARRGLGQQASPEGLG